VPGSNEQHSRCRSEENQELGGIEEEVESLHRMKKKGGRMGKNEKTDFRRVHPTESRAPEVDLAIPQPNVEQLSTTLQENRGMESSMICQSSGRCDCGSPNRQSRPASKHNLGGGRDAETQVYSPERR